MQPRTEFIKRNGNEHHQPIPRKIQERPDGRATQAAPGQALNAWGAWVKVLRVGVDGTDREIDAAAPDRP
jgi:hypothetical protein